MSRYRLLIILLLFSWPLSGKEVPRVVHFTKQDYRAQNQNWDIAQGIDFRMYFANSGGLLIFDGVRWQTLGTPSNQIVRTTHVDEKGRIFAGGYATLGYWEADRGGRLHFVSLLDSLHNQQIASEEIWHILPVGGGLLFQSFSNLLLYDGQTLKEITPPGNILFSRRVHGRILVPVIGSGLFEYDPSTARFGLVAGSEIFSQKKIATVLPFGNAGWLVCTENDGLFIYENGGFRPWEVPVSGWLKASQFNKGIRLANGNYAFGTILDGIFVTGADGQVLHHINQQNGLQNNTVLALFEDAGGRLWAGLDKGIDLIDLHSPLTFFQDKTGAIGTVYAAALFQDRLYVGTNQGIFYKNFPPVEGGEFRLLPGSQGHVWDLQVFDGQLLGGHNTGSFRVNHDRLEFLFANTGAYPLVRHPSRNDLLLQGTYTGIIVLQKDANHAWRFSHAVKDFYLPARKIRFDNQGKLWVLHPRKGLFRLTTANDSIDVSHVQSFGTNNGLPTNFDVDLTAVDGHIIVKSGNRYFHPDDAGQNLQPLSHLFGEPLPEGNFKLLSGRPPAWFQVFPDRVVFHQQNTRLELQVSLVPGNERIISLADSVYLFCMDDGYAWLNTANIVNASTLHPPAPLVTAVTTNDQEPELHVVPHLPKPFVFRPSENSLRFYFSFPEYVRQVPMRFRLLGIDDEWTPFAKIYTKEFTRLPPGEYEFQVQAEGYDMVAGFAFIVEPKWFQTLWAKLAGLLLLGLAARLLLRWHQHRLQYQERRLQLQKEQELQQQRIEAKNEKLQSEILSKSRLLADTTMNLVRKNEMLMKIKEELNRATRRNKTQPDAEALLRLNHLIDYHLTSEEDWQIFEANFNQLHDQFFKRLKDQFPDLTPGDMRLAAYLKMNLSSKEIAPLLNISLRGVENKRYRLRQKMGLDTEVNLTEFLMAY